MGKYFIVLTLICSTAFGSSQEEEAFSKAGEAFWKQSGIEKNVNVYIEDQLDKNLSKQYRFIASYVACVANIIKTGKVEIKWTF